MIEVPSIDDPRWTEWTRKLLDHLEEPRSWRMLRRWAKSHRIGLYLLRNMLAWLEETHRAKTVKLNEIFHWHCIGETDPAFRREVDEAFPRSGYFVTDMLEIEVTGLIAEPGELERLLAEQQADAEADSLSLDTR